MNTFNTKIIRSPFLLFYVFINLLFVYKYGQRQDDVDYRILMAAYPILLFALVFIVDRIRFITQRKHFGLVYVLICTLFLTLSVIINLYIDGHSLNVDRWSAMDVSIHAVLNGEYPYMAHDHLNGRSSNFPGLFLIGLPFYLLGDVGYLQTALIAALSILLFFSNTANKAKLLIILLLAMSPAFLWEITVKSDLMSNIWITLLFIAIWERYYPKDPFRRPFLLSFFVGVLFLTRGIVWIPLSLYLIGPFIRLNLVNKLKFMSGFIIGCLALSLPVFLMAPNFETIVKYNPLSLQTNLTPVFIQIVFIIVPVVLGLYIKAFKGIVYSTFWLYLGLMSITFFISLYRSGFENTVIHSFFDLSYLGTIIPFSIVAYTLSVYGQEVQSKHL